MGELETVVRVDKVTTRRGATYWRVHTVRGNLYFTDRPEALRPVRPGTAVELEYEDRAGYRFIKSLRLPDPFEAPPAASAPDRADGTASPAAPAPAELKALALDAALKMLSARGRPFGVDELLEAAERVLSWLR
jgi:hypothetical protein